MALRPHLSGPSRRGFLRAGVAAGASATVATGCAAGADSGVGPDGRVTIELWHGQTDTGRTAIESLIGAFHRSHPRIRVDSGGGVLADAMLQKVTAALASGSYPDVAYVFGSDLAGVARSPQVVDLTGTVRSGRTPWSDYWAPAREAVTVNGRVRAAPALLDSLAVVCNKKLFRDAGLALPGPGWSWRDFRETARRLTDSGGGVFGTGWPGVGDEDTVWRLWPMVWDLGGEVIAEDGRGIGFAEVGARALETVDALARDRSVYIGPKPGSEQMYQVFVSGRMGMVVTGPWQLPDIAQAKIDYHVVPKAPPRVGDRVGVRRPLGAGRPGAERAARRLVPAAAPGPRRHVPASGLLPDRDQRALQRVRALVPAPRQRDRTAAAADRRLPRHRRREHGHLRQDPAGTRRRGTAAGRGNHGVRAPGDPQHHHRHPPHRLRQCPQPRADREPPVRRRRRGPLPRRRAGRPAHPDRVTARAVRSPQPRLPQHHRAGRQGRPGGRPAAHPARRDDRPGHRGGAARGTDLGLCDDMARAHADLLQPGLRAVLGH